MTECRERFDWYRSVARSVSDFTLVDRSGEECPEPAVKPYAHLDPLFAADTDGWSNDFLVTVTGWLTDHRQ